ncbi:hypothetical protein COU57_00270 [Candidatus Pacearchaeota archaeon CG10_big_fil_rev_8_21_14_0_10_32_14]|nr:MAG: hypothetical protein COU57_00270 [Candidatus Pacearchaeota archaeon CG10_big_fil_rev_8_21_14_0_10_32_14]
MKKWIYFVIGIFLIIVLFIGILRYGFDKTGEDSWIKDERGIWIKHGNPSDIPGEVNVQQKIIECANKLYDDEKNNGVVFNSQCLGECDGFVVDIVHVPRNSDDNKIENQCEDYRNGKYNDFVELDLNGDVVRFVEIMELN